MKGFNIILLFADTTTEISRLCEKISDAPSVEDARRMANYARGMVQMLENISNAAICFENNNITPDLEAVTVELTIRIYQAVCDAAIKNGDDECFVKAAQKRDDLSKWLKELES